MRRALATGLVATALLGAPSVSSALDPPHDASRSIVCGTCHITHDAAGGTITTVAGNANLCLSCHTAGGQASAKPLATASQALPYPGLPAGVSPSGTSHRWDSGASGHVTFGGGTSTGRVQSGGAFVGPYAKTYTLTISTAGDVGTARFNWTAATPGGGSGSGTGVLTAASVPLDQGITVTFTNGTVSPSFRLNESWSVYVRPDVRQPVTAAMVTRLENGKLMCSTCHDAHSQAEAPFDPAAPAYGGAGTGAGRHFQRVAGDTDQGCKDCHNVRNVASAASGSHGVGIAVVPAAGRIQAPLVLPLDRTSNQLQCSTCHAVHGAANADGSLLRLAASRTVCLDCHTLADTSATPAKHVVTADARTLWPGGAYGTTFPARTAAGEQGSCTNCHQTHGWPDAANTAQRYPNLLVDREQNLCYTCHDGSPVVKNVRAQFGLGFAHPADTYTGRHAATEGGTPAAYGTANRHSECTDCHDAHQAKGDAVAPTAPAVSNRVRSVGGVQVTNGAAGATPGYTYVASATREYEICLKCHSSWTTQPAGQSNLAVRLNANNPSFHPVEAAGKNTGINVNSFVPGWNAAKLTYCTDCHTSSDTTVRGPHGSANRYVLKKPSTASSASRTMTSGESCFDCHNYNTYANAGSTNTVKGYSRFNLPTFDKGHTFHVADKKFPCYACHESHGSTTLPHLMVTGRSPGLNSYTHTATGGTCAPSCHGTETYTVNY